jgi:hypothetical protein
MLSYTMSIISAHYVAKRIVIRSIANPKVACSNLLRVDHVLMLLLSQQVPKLRFISFLVTLL